MKLFATALLLFLLPLAPSMPAQVGSSSGSIQDVDPLAEARAKITPRVFFYEPKHVVSRRLLDVGNQLYGRELLIADDFGQHNAANLMALDEDRLLVFDFPSQAQKILDLFKQLDVPSELVETPPLTSINYTPRHVPLEDLATALNPFMHSLENGSSNINTMRSSNMLLLRDTPERVDEMKDLLERIDVPSEQIELTCYILQSTGDDQASSDELPAELKSGLVELLPFYQFELATMGVLRLSTAASSQAKLDMQLLDSSLSYELALQIGAYDAARQNLTLNGIESLLKTPTGTTSLFRTDASIMGDEYAVIGATGAEPTFVVLHFKKIG